VWLISEFHGEVDSIPKNLKHVLPPTGNGILSLPFSSEIKDELLAKTTLKTLKFEIMKTYIVRYFI
jgi:hypothetical protein